MTAEGEGRQRTLLDLSIERAIENFEQGGRTLDHAIAAALEQVSQDPILTFYTLRAQSGILSGTNIPSHVLDENSAQQLSVSILALVIIDRRSDLSEEAKRRLLSLN